MAGTSGLPWGLEKAVAVKCCVHPVNADGSGDYYCHDQPQLPVLAPVGRTARLWWGGVYGGSLPQGETLCALFQKIKAVYDTNPTKFRTLQNILEVEKEMYGAEWPKVGATLALMWLKRGLRFIQVFLQSICDGERDENHPNLIRVNATKAYEMALKKYHGWIVQKIFQMRKLRRREAK
uniref:Glycolipid transfer protein n=1 Tax=Moschus moschiferus TaxID=68415 RepID=A0A8C6DPK8_MOSMO